MSSAFGIYLNYAVNNSLVWNTPVINTVYGVALFVAVNNTISDNTISNTLKYIY